jgi:hypothetical protein
MREEGREGMGNFIENLVVAHGYSETHVDRQRLIEDCETMRDATTDVHSVWGLLKTRPPTGEILRAFGFTNFSSFSSWRPPRS